MKNTCILLRVIVISIFLAFWLPVYGVTSPRDASVELSVESTAQLTHTSANHHATAETNVAKEIYSKEGKVKSYNIAKRIVRKISSKIKSPRPKRYKERGVGLAVASLVLGILGILIYFLVPASILAIIFGVTSMKRYNEGYHDRKGMARAGMILGIIGLSLSVLIFGFIFVDLFLFL